MVNDFSGFCRSGAYGDYSNTFPLTNQAFQHPFVTGNQIPVNLGSHYPTNFGGQIPYNVFNHNPYNVWAQQMSQANPYLQGQINPTYHPSYGVLMNSIFPGCSTQFTNPAIQQIPYGGQFLYQGHGLQTNAFSPIATSPFNNVWGFTPVACR